MKGSAAILAIALAAAAPAAGQGMADSARVDTIVVRPGPSVLALPASYYQTRIDYSLTMPAARSRPNLSGFEAYRLSRMQSTIKGAGMGMTAGFMAGALGEMTGAWNEKAAFGIAGAMAVFGALYGNHRADDDGWNLQIRLQEDRSPGSVQFDRK
jgi:hypothetical protein